MNKSFPVFSIDREDIKNYGYDGDSLTDEQMQTISAKMVEEMLDEGTYLYCIENGFTVYDAAIERVLKRLHKDKVLEYRIHLMPTNSTIVVKDVERSPDFPLIEAALKNKLLVVILCVQQNNWVKVTYHSAHRYPTSADEAADPSGSDSSVWVELISPIDWANWDYDWQW